VPRILVVDNEPTTVGFIKRALHAQKYATEGASSSRTCLAALASMPFDMVVLDLVLPDVTDLSLIEAIRSKYPTVKIIVVTGVLDVRDKVRCFRLGVVDYLTKPFAIAELVARIEIRLNEKTPQANGDRHTCAGNMTLDPSRHTVGVRGRSIALSQREYNLLSCLTTSDKAMTREQLLTTVWGFDFGTDSNVVDVYVKRLRTKLGADVIETVRNVGYRIPAA
jgi:two-component system, OmpR family, response regulator